MKFELIVFERDLIYDIPAGWAPTDWFKVEVRAHDDIRRIDSAGRGTGSGKGLIFSFDADIPDGWLMLSHLRAAVDHMSRDKAKWPEYEVRINRVLLDEFYKGVSRELDHTVREAIKLLKQSRGRKPSKKEAAVRKLLEAALPENMDWLNREGMSSGKYPGR